MGYNNCKYWTSFSRFGSIAKSYKKGYHKIQYKIIILVEVEQLDNLFDKSLELNGYLGSLP